MIGMSIKADLGYGFAIAIDVSEMLPGQHVWDCGVIALCAVSRSLGALYSLVVLF